MRLYEFAEKDALLLDYYFLIEEERSRFGFIKTAAAQAAGAVKGVANQAAGAVKGVANQVVTVVKNSNDAIRLIPQIINDPEVLAKAIPLLRMALKQELAQAHPSVAKLANSISGTSVSTGDFFKTLLVYAAVKGMNMITPTAITLNVAASAAGKEIYNQLSKITGLAGNLVSAGAGNLMTVLDTLKIAHNLFFDVLSRIAKNLGKIVQGVAINGVRGKINLAKVVEAKGHKLGGWFLINSLHEPIRPVTDANFTEMSAFYASPKAGDGYLGFIDSEGKITHHLMTNHANQIGTIPGKPW